MKRWGKRKLLHDCCPQGEHSKQQATRALYVLSAGCQTEPGGAASEGLRDLAVACFAHTGILDAPPDDGRLGEVSPPGKWGWVLVVERGLGRSHPPAQAEQETARNNRRPRARTCRPSVP